MKLLIILEYGNVSDLVTTALLNTSLTIQWSASEI